MDDTDSSLASHRNGHTVLGNCVHSGTHKGNVKSDLLGQLSVKVYLIGDDLGVRRNQQDIIKCDTVFYYLCHDLPFRSESACK